MTHLLHPFVDYQTAGLGPSQNNPFSSDQYHGSMCVSADRSAPGEIAEALSIHLVLRNIRGEEVCAIAMSGCDQKTFSLTRLYATT